MNMVLMILVYAAVIGAFYFFAIRPQKKQQKEHEATLAAVAIGDSILTTSGFYGVVIDMTEDIVCLLYTSK